MQKIPMTRAGVNALEEELRHIKTVLRPQIIEQIAEARAHGDLSENAEYSAAKEKQSFNEGRIKELESVLSAAEIIDPLQFAGQKTVRFGAKVVIADEDTDEEKNLQIVGEYESNADQGRISVTSPVARALIGKAEGDSIKVTTPRGTASYEIVSVCFE